MNPRIQKLAEQSFIVTTDGEIGMVNTHMVTVFAESIVRECMRLNRDILCRDDPDYLDKIYRDHFGIK
jgi:hypothetical protein